MPERRTSRARIPEGREDEAEEGMDYALDMLDLVPASLPHLSGLAYAVNLTADYRVPTAGIFASGRLVFNPEWFLKLARPDAIFVMAHELLHLALRSHERDDRSDPHLFNIAHDCIINDILVEGLGRQDLPEPVPASGWHYPGARDMAVEQLITLIRKGIVSQRGQSNSPMAEAMRKAGLTPPEMEGEGDDILSDEEEREMYPGTDPKNAEEIRQRIREAAARAASLDRLRESLDRMLGGKPVVSVAPGEDSAMVTALKTAYRPPWEMALQQWMESVAPGPRSFARPSRRGADRRDVVLPGRTREGWVLHIILDTSGSMADELAKALGSIGSFCDAVGVAQVRIIQCDVEVTADEYVAPESLATYRIAGFGGSDMTPAMAYLAQDPEVEAAIIITDGYIDFPDDPPPYAVLWAITSRWDGHSAFEPPYGRVVIVPS